MSQSRRFAGETNLVPLPGFELRFLGRIVRSHNSGMTTHTVLIMTCRSRRKTNRPLLNRTSELHVNDLQHRTGDLCEIAWHVMFLCQSEIHILNP